MLTAFLRALGRWLAGVLLAALVLQVFFLGRIALLASANPASTSMERSQLWQRWQPGAAPSPWQHHWVDYAAIATPLKQAVLTAEDDLFTQHRGVQWQAIQQAWRRNQQALAQASQAGTSQPVRLYGGSTITQQLAKNLLLSGERSLLRKGQELILTLWLELLLDKRRILELYLNHAEWGAGIFGAEAAARHYFGKSARQLNAQEAAHLAVILPRPRYYQAQFHSSRHVQQRSRAIARRMAATAIP